MSEEILNDGAPAPSVEPTLRETIGAAIEKQREGAPAAPDGEGKAPAAPAHESDEAKAARLRDADGRFAKKAEGVEPGKIEAPKVAEPGAEVPKQDAGALRPPPGFSVQSKAAWDALPESIKSDIAKREAEVDAGFKRYSGLGKYAQEAERNGTTLQSAVDDYFSIEQGLRKDFMSGLEGICRRFGVDPRALTTAMGQRYGMVGAPAPQGQRAQVPAQPQFDPRQIEDRAVARVQQQFEAREVSRQIEEFSADPKNRYFENVKTDMALLLQNGKASNLREAYDAACWLNPEIRGFLLKETAAGNTNAAAAANQARAAAKAVGGAPAAGFNPADKGLNPNLSTRETIKAAIAAQRARA